MNSSNGEPTYSSIVAKKSTNTFGCNLYYFAIYHQKSWKMFEDVRGDRTTTNYGCHTSTLVWIKFLCLPNGSTSDVDEHKSND